MKFAEPLWLLMGLVACGLLVFTWNRHDLRQRVALASFAAGHLQAQLTASFSVVRRRWKRGLFLVSVALLFAALARPQMGYRWEETKRRGIEILFAVDTSKSMLSTDVKPDRLTRAKLAVDDFVNKLDGDGVGLVAFAGNAFLQCPITLDYNAFNESLMALDTNTIPRGGTDISSAIREAQTALATRPSTDKILILLTDGEDLEGSAVDVARDAAKAGLKIYTVGVGTANGELIPASPENGGGFVKDDSGQFVKSHLDSTKLQAIAEATGGIYAPLGAQGEGLETIYQKGLAPLVRHDLASRQERVYIERFQWCLAPALLLLTISLLLGTRKTIRKPVVETSAPVPVIRRRRLVLQPAMTLIGLALIGSLTMAHASIRDAETAFGKGDYATAQKEFEAAAQNHSQKDTLHYDAGAAAYRAGDYTQAAANFQKALEGKPSADPKQVTAQQDVYYNLGNTLYRTGQKTEKGDAKQTIQSWEQAVKSYDAALQLRTEDADAKFNRDFVQKKLDELKKQQEQQKQDQKQNQQKDQKDQDQQQQNQGQPDKNQQGQSGQGSNDKSQDAKDGKDSPDQKSGQDKQQQNPDGKGDQSKQDQANQSGQQPKQDSTAQNSNKTQPGTKPDQQQNQQANNGSPNGDKPQSQNGQKPDAGNGAGGNSVAQNGDKIDQTGHTSEQRVPGEMSKQEAKQLLDSLRDEQQQMPGTPVARSGGAPSPDQPYKDW